MTVTILPTGGSMLVSSLPYILVCMFGFMVIMFIRIESRLGKMEGQIALLLKGRKLKMNDT